jgi:hypothetical protein
MNLMGFIKNKPLLCGYFILLRERIDIITWLIRGSPSPPPHIIKQRRVLWAQKTFGLNTLVETGTFMGDMISASLHAFNTIYSIELSEELWQSARDKFAKYPNVHILKGDSATVLPEVLKKLTEPSVFWLDAHYSEGNTAKGVLDTPIAAELKCIFESHKDGHVILIDDANLFIGKNDYPTLEELRSFIYRAKPSYNFEIKDDIIHIY